MTALVHEDGAGLGLDVAVEVAVATVRHQAVPTAVSRLGALQRVRELGGPVGRSLAWRLNRERDKGMPLWCFSYRKTLQLRLSLTRI